MEKITVSNGQG